MLNKTIPNFSVGKAVLDDLYEANKEWWPELKDDFIPEQKTVLV